MSHSVTVAGRRATPEERAVLDAIEHTGNPADSGLPALAVAEAMIWLANAEQPLVTEERLPHPNADRRAWVDYVRRLHLELPRPATGRTVTIEDLRHSIGARRLWTTTVPALAQEAA